MKLFKGLHLLIFGAALIAANPSSKNGKFGIRKAYIKQSRDTKGIRSEVSHHYPSETKCAATKQTMAPCNTNKNIDHVIELQLLREVYKGETNGKGNAKLETFLVNWINSKNNTWPIIGDLNKRKADAVENVLTSYQWGTGGYNFLDDLIQKIKDGQNDCVFYKNQSKQIASKVQNKILTTIENLKKACKNNFAKKKHFAYYQKISVENNSVAYYQKISVENNSVCQKVCNKMKELINS